MEDKGNEGWGRDDEEKTMKPEVCSNWRESSGKNDRTVTRDPGHLGRPEEVYFKEYRNFGRVQNGWCISEDPNVPLESSLLSLT